LGKDVVEIGNGIMKELGYRAICNSHFTNNIRSGKLSHTQKMSILGVVPRLCYLSGVGWQDMVLTYMELTDDSVKTFSQLLEDNRRLRAEMKEQPPNSKL
jgi:hypothetical protein